MKSYADHASHVLLGLTLGVLAMSSGLWTPAHAGSAVGKVTVMDVDEVRDAASIQRAKARNRSDSAGSESGGGDVGTGGCSDLNIGNVKTGVGQPVPRNVVVVIEGPVIQENKCR